MGTEISHARMFAGPRIAVVVAVIIAAYFLAATTYTREEAHAIGDAALGMSERATPSINALVAARHHLQRVAFLLQEEVDAPSGRAGRRDELERDWRDFDGDLRRYETLPPVVGERALWPSVTRAADALDALRLRLDLAGTAPPVLSADDVFVAANRLDAAIESVIRFDAGYELRLAGTIARLNARITREDVGLDAIGGLLALALAWFAWWSSTRFERLREQHQRLREAQASEAEQSEARLRAEWNAIVAHDLRQPLAAINAGARLLTTPSDAAERAADIVRVSVKRLNRMINDLLDLSRLEARRLPLQRREVELGEVVHAAVAHVALQSPERRIDERVAPSLPPIDADASRLEQVLENLLTNALKYGDPAHDVVVEAQAVGGEVTVSVTNHGAGIAPEDLPVLFQRFGLPRHGPRAPGSVGLGLYIVRELVEAHGGRVGVRSTPGERTTFHFTLPTAPPHGTPSLLTDAGSVS